MQDPDGGYWPDEDVIGFDNDGTPVLRPTKLLVAVFNQEQLPVGQLDLQKALLHCESSPDGQRHTIESKLGPVVWDGGTRAKLVEPENLPDISLDTIEPEPTALSGLDEETLSEITSLWNSGLRLRGIKGKVGLTYRAIAETPIIREYIRRRIVDENVTRDGLATELGISQSSTSEIAEHLDLKFDRGDKNTKNLPKRRMDQSGKTNGKKPPTNGRRT